MNIVITVFDDWQGIYVDGKLKFENHSLHYKDIFDVLDIKYEAMEIDMMELDLGRLPKTIKELQKLIGENE